MFTDFFALPNMFMIGLYLPTCQISLIYLNSFYGRIIAAFFQKTPLSTFALASTKIGLEHWSWDMLCILNSYTTHAKAGKNPIKWSNMRAEKPTFLEKKILWSKFQKIITPKPVDRFSKFQLLVKPLAQICPWWAGFLLESTYVVKAGFRKFRKIKIKLGLG